MNARDHIEQMKLTATGLPPTRYIGCGNCKGTGWKHAWNTSGDFLPVEPPATCPNCEGYGQLEEQK